MLIFKPDFNTKKAIIVKKQDYFKGSFEWKIHSNHLLVKACFC
jgi:hypothetical protein